MPKKNRNLTIEDISKKNRIENYLRAIPPFCNSARKMVSTKGFINYYESMKHLYPTFLMAYERLEEFHIAITGNRKYSDFNTFMVIVRRIERGR